VFSEIVSDCFELKASSTPRLESIYTSRGSPVLLSPGKQITNVACPIQDVQYAAQTKRILTDVYLHNEERHLHLEGYIDQIQNYLTHYDVPWEEQTVLVLETRNDRMIGYYFVDHVNQSIFWLDPFRFVELDELRVEFSSSHVGEFPTVVAVLSLLHQDYRSSNAVSILVSFLKKCVTTS
jgi:hypothetical protein